MHFVSDYRRFLKDTFELRTEAAKRGGKKGFLLGTLAGTTLELTLTQPYLPKGVMLVSCIAVCSLLGAMIERGIALADYCEAHSSEYDPKVVEALAMQKPQFTPQEENEIVREMLRPDPTSIYPHAYELRLFKQVNSRIAERLTAEENRRRPQINSHR